jgi:beta-aspartyl-dipeptidase (metallo-type)
MLLLIENGDVFTPVPKGIQSVLCSDTVVQVGADARALSLAHVPLNTLDATGCYIIPGMVDPHANIVGAGAECGFIGRTPEIVFEDIIESGITTIIGTLGTDVVGRTLPDLLSKTIQLNQSGMTAFMYTGPFEVPPQSLLRSIKHDIALFAEVIGTGEVAISDSRSTAPTIRELARIVGDTKMGGMLGGKAGVTHFHVGDSESRLAPLHVLLDRYPFEPGLIYPTHVARNDKLLNEAVKLAQRGCYVDIDAVEPGVGRWIRQYLELGGPSAQLTISSDAQTPGASTGSLHREFVDTVHAHGFGMEETIRYFGTNTARVLKLPRKGALEQGSDADIVVLDKDTLEVRHVIVAGRVLFRDGKFCGEKQPDPASKPERLEA